MQTADITYRSDPVIPFEIGIIVCCLELKNVQIMKSSKRYLLSIRISREPKKDIKPHLIVDPASLVGFMNDILRI
jgi:hypothetical protein